MRYVGDGMSGEVETHNSILTVEDIKSFIQNEDGFYRMHNKEVHVTRENPHKIMLDVFDIPTKKEALEIWEVHTDEEQQITSCKRTYP